MRIDQATKAQVRFVSEWMREKDYAEIASVQFCENREELATLLTEMYGGLPDTLCATWWAIPVAVGGFYQFRPRVATMAMWATDMFPRIGLGLTRFLVREMMPRLEAIGVHRFECASRADYTEVHAWLRTLGLEQESAPMRNYGRNGESFIMFSKVVDARPTGSGE